MHEQDPMDADQTVAAPTTTERRPYSAPFVKRLDVTDTEGKGAGVAEHHTTHSDLSGVAS